MTEPRPARARPTVSATVEQPAAPHPEVGGRTGIDARRCFVSTVLALAVFNVARALGLLGPAPLSATVLTVVVVAIALWCRVTAADLGLAGKDVASGVRYGVAALLVVLAALVVAAAIPATSGYLHDSRARIDGARLAYDIGVSVVLLTAIPEELAFRGVLLGAGRHLWSTRRAVLLTSALFGLWHIAPTLSTMHDNSVASDASATVGGAALVVAGNVAVTFAAGLVFCWLRLRSRSLVAPIVAHVATNGLALAVAWVSLR